MLLLEKSFGDPVEGCLSGGLDFSPFHMHLHLSTISENVSKTQELGASQLGWTSCYPPKQRPREGRRPAQAAAGAHRVPCGFLVRQGLAYKGQKPILACGASIPGYFLPFLRPLD